MFLIHPRQHWHVLIMSQQGVLQNLRLKARITVVRRKTQLMQPCSEGSTICLYIVTHLQGRSIPTSEALEAYTSSTQTSDSWTDASISILGWSAPAPSPATIFLPSLAPVKSSQRHTRRLAESVPPANATAGHAQAPWNMCVLPLICKWSYDKDGMARPDCYDPPHTPRFLGVLCPDSIPLAFLTVVMILYLVALGFLYKWLVRYWANKVFPGKNRWTRTCYIAFALGLILGLRCYARYRVQIDTASPPGQQDMCLSPPSCDWRYDESGAAHLSCGTPPIRPRILGVMCLDHIPFYVAPNILVADFKVVFAYIGFGLMLLAHLLARVVRTHWVRIRIQIPWTRMCCFAYIWGLIIGLAWSTSVSVKTNIT